MNYTLAHVLHLTVPVTHLIVIPLNAMFRGMSGSFGSAISGGLFARVLRSTLESDFADHGLKGKESLVRQLLGTPTLVKSLVGVERKSLSMVTLRLSGHYSCLEVYWRWS